MTKSFRRVAIITLMLAATLTLGVGSVSTVFAAAPFASYGPVTYAVLGEDSDFWTCSGYRLEAGPAVQDHFTCTIVDQTFSGTFSEAKPWPCGCSGWASDFDGQVATSYVINVLSNGTVIGTAWY